MFFKLIVTYKLCSRDTVCVTSKTMAEKVRNGKVQLIT